MSMCKHVYIIFSHLLLFTQNMSYPNKLLITTKTNNNYITTASIIV